MLTLNGIARDKWDTLRQKAESNNLSIKQMHQFHLAGFIEQGFRVSSHTDPSHYRMVTLYISPDRKVSGSCSCEAHQFGRLCTHIALAISQPNLYSFLTGTNVETERTPPPHVHPDR